MLNDSRIHGLERKGLFSCGPVVGGEGVRTELGLPNVEKTIGAVTEIDIYELFAFKHCKGMKVKLALCEELDDRMQDLKIELQSFDSESDEIQMRKAQDALKRIESWNLFGDTYEKVRHTKQLPVDLKGLMNGLSSLVLPSQRMMFGSYAHSMSTLEVPIFWFIHRDALLVDKHYQTKALADMVIVVQSETSSWESHVQCNGNHFCGNSKFLPFVNVVNEAHKSCNGCCF